MIVWGIVALVALGLIFIRVAPSDTARWHVDVPFDTAKNMKSGAARVIEGDTETLQAVVSAAQITGARVLAGSVEDGHITLIARTMWIGFPDYITLQRKGDQIVIWGRLRFGLSSDLGVNGKRIDGWLRSLS